MNEANYPDRRALRGGSWNNPAQNARAAYRNDNHRTDRNDNIGFRLVLSSIAAARGQSRSAIGGPGCSDGPGAASCPVGGRLQANRKAPRVLVGVRMEVRPRRLPGSAALLTWAARGVLIRSVRAERRRRAWPERNCRDPRNLGIGNAGCHAAQVCR